MNRLKKFEKLLISALIVALLICTSVSFCGCKKNAEGTIFGTYYSLEFSSSDAIKSAGYKKNILEDWNTLESLGSTQVATSDVAKINAASAGEAIQVSDFTINCLKLAKKYNELFPEFNPAIYPLVELWKFSPDTFIGVAESIPTAEEIADVLTYCTLDAFTLDENAKTITKTNDKAKLDFGSFLKGVAVDDAKSTLEDCSDYLINLGGTVTSESTATIAIANPRGGEYRATVEITKQAVATSGDYERYYIYNGKRYHHIIGKDGYPAGIQYATPITSVTVVGESATICDILSTAVFIKGTEADSMLKLMGYSALILTDISAQQIGADNATWNIL